MISLQQLRCAGRGGKKQSQDPTTQFPLKHLTACNKQSACFCLNNQKQDCESDKVVCAVQSMQCNPLYGSTRYVSSGSNRLVKEIDMWHLELTNICSKYLNLGVKFIQVLYLKVQYVVLEKTCQPEEKHLLWRTVMHKKRKKERKKLHLFSWVTKQPDIKKDNIITYCFTFLYMWRTLPPFWGAEDSLFIHLRKR